MGSIYQPAPENETGRYRPFAVAAGVIVLIGIVAFLLARNAPKPSPEPGIDPYAEHLVISDAKMSQAQNFVGGSVTYVEGKVSNVGPKTVTGITTQSVFRNTLGEVVDKPIEPMRVRTTELGNPDFVNLAQAPLTPNASREFRLTFEHVSADWNQGLPEIRVIKVEAK